MKLSPKMLMLAACTGMTVGMAPYSDGTSSNIQHHHQSPYMYASSHTLAQRQVNGTPDVVTSVSLTSTVVDGLTGVVPADIIAISRPASNSTATSSHPDPDIVQVEAITTLTSVLGSPSSTTKSDTKETGSSALTLTSTVDEFVTVTWIKPSSTSFPEPQSQIQGSSSSAPSMSFVPVASTTSTAAPTASTKSHVVPAAGGYAYLGCYAEGFVDRALGDAFYPNDENTIERCAAACYPYKYAGAEYGRECWCGNSLKKATKVSESDFCNMPCAGDEQQYCGGNVALNVYIVKGADSSDLVPVTESGTAKLSFGTSSSSVFSNTASVSSTQTTKQAVTSSSLSLISTSSGSALISPTQSTSQAIILSTSSSVASTRLASTSNTVTSSKASSDSQVLTASSIPSVAASSSSSSAITSISQTTFVTSTQAFSVSAIVENGTTTTTSLTTRTENSTICASTQSSIFTLPSAPSTHTLPLPLFLTTKVSITDSITALPVPTSKKIDSIPTTITYFPTVTAKPIPIALPMVESSTSSPSTTSKTSKTSKSKSTSSPTSTSTSTSTTKTTGSDTSTGTLTDCPIPNNCDATVVIPTAAPSSNLTEIPESWGGIWTTPPPQISLVPAIPQLASPCSEKSTALPTGIAVDLDTFATSIIPAHAPPQMGYAPVCTIGPQMTIPTPILPSILGPSTSTVTRSIPHFVTPTYGTRDGQPLPSVVTVTSFLTPTTILPTAGTSFAQEVGLKMMVFLTGLLMLIFVI